MKQIRHSSCIKTVASLICTSELIIKFLITPIFKINKKIKNPNINSYLDFCYLIGLLCIVISFLSLFQNMNFLSTLRTNIIFWYGLSFLAFIFHIIMRHIILPIAKQTKNKLSKRSDFIKSFRINLKDELLQKKLNK